MKKKFQLKMQHPKISQWRSYEKNCLKTISILKQKPTNFLKMMNKRMKMNLQNFNVQKIKWKHDGKNGFFVLTITKKLIVKFFKWCVVLFVTQFYQCI